MNDEIVLPGIGKIKVRRGKNIRFLSVRIAPGRGVWVNVPFGVSGRQVEEFVHTQRDWIEQNLAKIKVYEKDTGVGLGMDSEVKTKFLVKNEEAQGELLKAKALGGPGKLGDLKLVESLNPKVETRIIYAGPGTLWTDLKNGALPLPASRPE